MKNVLICFLIAGIIYLVGTWFLNLNEGKYETIEARVTEVVYFNNGANVYYSYTHPTEFDTVEGYRYFKNDELVLGLYLSDTVKVTVDATTMRPHENVTVYNETAIRYAVYGFTGFFVLAGIINIFHKKD